MTITLIRTKFSEKLFFGLGLVAALFLLIPKSANAIPLIISKTSFSMTFENGYGIMPFMPVADSAFNVVDTLSGDAFVIGRSHHSSSPASAAIYLSVLTQTMVGQMVRTDSTTKTLGGNVFASVGYKEVGVDADTSTRLRIYVTTKGNLMFIVQLIYNIEDGAGSVARLEENLKSLDIHSAASLRTVAMKDTQPGMVSQFDLQGRNYGSFLRASRIPLFKQP